MGEWSEYFEDFPEENPANWVNGEFNPRLAQEIRNQETKFRISGQKKLDYKSTITSYQLVD